MLFRSNLSTCQHGRPQFDGFLRMRLIDKLIKYSAVAAVARCQRCRLELYRWGPIAVMPVGRNAVDEQHGTRLAAFEQPLRVLVVDPDYDARAFVRDALEGHAQVIGRTSARRARETLRVARFDVLVLDLILSGTRGIQFLDHLPADQRPERVVILTGWRDGWSAARQRGVDAMLRKPCTSDALREAVLGTRDTRPLPELAGAPHARLAHPPANGTHADPESRYVT